MHCSLGLRVINTDRSWTWSRVCFYDGEDFNEDGQFWTFNMHFLNVSILRRKMMNSLNKPCSFGKIGHERTSQGNVFLLVFCQNLQFPVLVAENPWIQLHHDVVRQTSENNTGNFFVNWPVDDFIFRAVESTSITPSTHYFSKDSTVIVYQFMGFFPFFVELIQCFFILALIYGIFW